MLLNAVLFTICILGGIQNGNSLKCFNCLNLDCPLGNHGEPNDKLCQSVRSYIVFVLTQFYELGPHSYIPPCPDLQDTLKWSILQSTSSPCSDSPEATCSLGRLQIRTPSPAGSVTSHATILGCVKTALMRYMKRVTNLNSCSVYKQNGTDPVFSMKHDLMLENCPKLTDYCYSKSFCVPFTESGVRPFVDRRAGNSFESGLVIGIIAIIIVVVGIVLMANYCKNPLNRGSNYSPAQVQTTVLNPKDEAQDEETGSVTKDKEAVFT